MIEQEFKYFAFISYSGKNEKWAKWLHSHLENYHIPTVLCKENPNIPKKIRPVFWYRKDLSGTKLKEALEKELGASQYLIVICSPESAKSNWVNDEVKSFISKGRGKYIIPFIVDGAPHSTNMNEECFPESLRILSREDEIRGISVLSDGKHHALVDVVATMFGVSFDTLWQRHKRRERKIRNIWIGICSLIIICSLEFWDYTRTKVEYYADYVDIWGLPKGIIPLTNEQVSHRNASYRFEYHRIPFGESGFYKWRIQRMSIVNSKGVISSYIPYNHENYYPVQEFIFDDGHQKEIINKDKYNRIIMRYTITDDYDNNSACLYDLAGKDVRQESMYLNASTTAMDFENNTYNNKSKIKRFHYTRNEEGYITKVTYHAHDDSDLKASAIGDNNNIYGRLYHLDSLGRVVKTTYINNDGNTIPDKSGVASVRYFYGDWGVKSIEYYDIDGQLVFNKQKYARLDQEFDQYGNPVEVLYKGSDGKLCYNFKNISREIVSYDDNGFLIKSEYLDSEGNLSYCTDNYAIQKVIYDKKGRPVKCSYFDINEAPCYDKENIHSFTLKYNSNNCILEQRNYDISGNPCFDKTNGVHYVRQSYDDSNYEVKRELFDGKLNRCVSPVMKFAIQELAYDKYHNIISESFFDSKGKPCYNNYSTSVVKCAYDARGNVIKIENLDVEGKPCIQKDGAATVLYKYDNYGNLTEEKYLGTDGKPMYINMVASVQYEYTGNGLLREERMYDEEGKLCTNKDWYAIAKYEYDSNGNQIKKAFFDSDSKPCYVREWVYSSMEIKYNNNKVEEKFYDTQGHLMLNAKHYAISRIEYDRKGNMISLKYYNQDGRPCMATDLVHCWKNEYDDRGLHVRSEAFDNQMNRCVSKYGYSIQENIYNEKGMLTQYTNLDTGGKIMHADGIVGKYIVNYDNLGRCISEYACDEKDSLMWFTIDNGISESVCLREYEYDDRGNIVRCIYKDPQRNLTVRNGWAICEKHYDDLSRVVETRYYDDNHQSMGGYYRYPIEKYVYGDNYDKMSLFLNDTTLVVNVNGYYEKSVRKRISYTDSNDKPCIFTLMVFDSTPFATCITDRDNRGNVEKVSYYDEMGNLFDTEVGYAYTTFQYSEKGVLEKTQFFNRSGTLVNDKVTGAATIVLDHDNYQNLTGQSYYDKDGNQANTPWGWYRRLWRYNDKGEQIWSKFYYTDGRVEEAILQTDGSWLSTSKDPTPVPREERMTFILSVEKYGQMYEAGFRGTYTILKFNNWNTSEDLESFIDEVQRANGKTKHLLLLQGVDNLDDKQVIETTFSEAPLAARIMDMGHKTDENRKAAIRKYNEWKNKK